MRVVTGPHATDQPIAIQKRHLDVGNQHFDLMIAHKLLPASLAIVRQHHVVIRLEHFLDGPAHDLRIVHD